MNAIKRSYRALALALFSLLGVTFGFAVEAPVRILPLGDSLTSGLSSAPVQGAYRNRLYTQLTGAGYNVDFIGTFSDTANPSLPDVNHQGQGGFRVDQIQSNLEGWLSSVEDPDVVLLLIGTNDFYQNYQLATIQTRLTNLIADIATKKPFAKIIVSSLPPRTDNAGIEAQQVAYNNAIPGIVAGQVALGRQVSFVDIHAALTNADINGDGLHPTATGYNKMGDAWFPAITSVISPQGTANPPVIARTGPMLDLTHVSVVFSKPVADSAASLANFSIPGLTISSAVLDPATKRTITLTTSTQTPGIFYTLAVSGVVDRTAQQTMIPPGSMVNFLSADLLQNGSFEQVSGATPTGWTASGNFVVENSNTYSNRPATSGTKMIAFNTGQLPGNAVLSQTFPTTPGQSYAVNFDLGIYAFNTNTQSLRTNITGNTPLITPVVETLTGNGNAVAVWTPKSYAFVADSTSTTVTFTDISTNSDSIDMLLDNVRVGPPNYRTLAVTSSPTSAAAMTITPSDALANGDGATGLIRSYSNGTAVTVTAPMTYAGKDFLRWQKNGIDLPGSTSTINVTMDANYTLNAVYGINTAPIALADSYSTPLNTQLVVPAIGVLTNDTSSNANPLTAVLNTTVSHGTLSLNSNGSFTYTPANGYQGSDSFSYHANDGNTDSSVVTVSLTITAYGSQMLVNGSFESGYTGWTPTGSQQIEGNTYYGSTDPINVVVFNIGQTATGSTLTQSFATVAGQTYQLLFDQGVVGSAGAQQQVRVSLTGSSALITPTTFTATIPTGQTRTWVPRSLSFTANSASTTLTFLDNSTTGSSVDQMLDNVRVLGAATNRTLTVESSPINGVSVALSPADFNGFSSGATSFTRTYPEGTIVNLFAPAVSSGANFVKWQKNGADLTINRNTSVTIDANVTVTAVYEAGTPPTADADSYSAVEGALLTVASPGVLDGDTDNESDPLIAVVVSPPANGTLNLNVDGGFTYISDTGFTGADTFTYKANDGFNDSNVATVTITVSPAVPPLITNGSFEFGAFEGPLNPTIPFNHFLLDNWNPTGNAVGFGQVSGVPATHLSRMAIFNGAVDTYGSTISQTFTTIPGESYQLQFDAGLAGAPNGEQLLGVSVTGNASVSLLAQDVTVQTLTGATTWAPSTFYFTANGPTATITFTDKSGTMFNTAPAAGSDMLLDNVRVIIYNAIPVADNEAYTINQDTPLAVAAPGVLAGDTDGDLDTLTAVQVTAPSNGTLALNPDGGFTYTPNAGFAGVDSFTYKADDGSVFSNVATVTITVLSTGPSILLNGSFESGNFISSNGTTPFGHYDLTDWTRNGNAAGFAQIPVTAPATDGVRTAIFNGANNAYGGTISQTFTTIPGGVYQLQFDAGVVGDAGDLALIGATVTGTANASLLNQGASLQTTTGAMAWSSHAFLFVANGTSATLTFTDNSSSTADGSDMLLDRVRVVLIDSNAPPVADNESYTTDRNVPLVVTAPGLLDGDTDADLDSLTAVQVTGPSHGTLAINPNGGFTYTPTTGYVGSDSFTYSANDGFVNSDPATVSITVLATGPNTAPVAVADSYSAFANNPLTVPASGVLANDTDVDANTLTAALDTQPTNGTVTLNLDGSFVYTPAPGYLGADSFTYHANDGNADSNVVTVSLTVLPYNSQLLVNGSFESNYTGWTPSGTQQIEGNTFYGASDGTKVVVFNIGQVAPNSLLSQSFGTVPGQVYRLSFDMGAVGGAITQTVQATLTGTSNVLTQSFSVTGGPTNTWVPQTALFTANSATTTLTFADVSPTGSAVDLTLDNVRVVAVPPNRTITIASSPGSGIPVDISPADLNTNTGGVTSFTRTYADATTVNLNVPTRSGNAGFVKWQKNGVDYSSSPNTSVLLNSDMTLTAVYQTGNFPVADDDSYSTSINTALTVSTPGVLANDTDLNGSPLTAVLDTQPSHGTVTLNANGSFVYTPATGYVGTDSFTYHANDGTTNSNVVPVFITVNTYSTQLLVNGSFESYYTGWTKTGDQNVEIFTGYYYPTDGTKTVVFNVGQTSNNSVLFQSFPTVPGQTYQLTFDQGALGTNGVAQRMEVSLVGSSALITPQTFTINGLGGTTNNWSIPSRSVSFTANSANTTVTFRDTSSTGSGIDQMLDNVKVIGAGPNQTLTVNSTPGSGIPIVVSPADKNSAAGGSTNFTRSYGMGSIVNLSAPLTAGTKEFIKWQKNGVDFTNNPNISVTMDTGVTVTAVYTVGTEPIAVVDAYSTGQNSELSIAAPGVLANDSSVLSNPLTAVLDTPPSHGTLTLNSNGSFVYIPTPGYLGPDSFTYHANDGVSNSLATTVSLNVIEYNVQLITNGSFESAYTAWTHTGTQQIEANNYYGSTNGTAVVVFNIGQVAPNAVISQSFPTVPGQLYRLTFDMGAIGSTSTQTVQATLAGTSNLLTQTFSVNGLGGAVNNWASKSATFTANSTTTTLTLTDVSPTGESIDLTLDNIRVVAVAPSRTLTVASSPGSGVPVELSPADNNANAGGVTSFARTFDNGAGVNLSAPILSGTAGFVKWQKNGADFSSSPNVNLTVNGDLTLTAVYQTGTFPVADDDAYSTGISTPLTVAASGVLANDIDLNGSPLTAVLDTQPSHGTVTLNTDGSFVYTPTTGYQGSDSFTYHANDGTMNSNVVPVNITVSASTSQLLVNGSFESGYTGWTPGGTQQIEANSFYGSSDGLAVAVFNIGQVTPNATLSQTFPTVAGRVYQLTFDQDAVGTPGVQQRVEVSLVGSSNLITPQTFTVTVPAGTDNLWTSRSISFTANSATTTLTFRDTSSTGNSVDQMIDNVKVNGAGPNRTLTVNSSPLTGVSLGASPADINAAGSGSTNFTRIYADATIVNLSAPAAPSNSVFVKWQKNGVDFSSNPNISITVNADMTFTAIYAVGTPPVADNDSYSTSGDFALVVPAPGVLDGDTDGEGDPLTAVLVSNPSNGVLAFDPDGSFTYTQNSGFVGTDSFTYKVYDGTFDSNTATVTITVNPAPPSLALNGSFESGDFVPGAPSPAITFDHFLLNNWTVTGNPVGFGQIPNVSARDGVRMAIFNGATDTYGGTVSQTFATIPGATYQLKFDTGVVGNPNTSQFLWAAVTGNGGGTILGQQTSISTTTGAVAWTTTTHLFTANSLTSTLTFTDISNSAANSSDMLLDKVSVILVETNTAPVATNKSYITSANTALAVIAPGLLVGDTDAELDPLTAAAVTSPTHGNLALNSNGSFIYTPNNGFTGTDSFTYKANDGYLDSTPATITITVNAAVASLLTNGSFESGTPVSSNSGPIPFDHFQLASWTSNGNPAGFAQIPGVSATDGTRMAIFNGALNTYGGTISQTFTTIPGAKYQLAFDAAVVGSPGDTQHIAVSVTGTGNSVLLAPPALPVVTPTGATTWTPASYMFTANGASTTLTFTDSSGPDADGSDMLLDKVRVFLIALNAAPTANNDSYSMDEDTVLSVTAPGVLVNDSDSDSTTITSAVVDTTTHGTLVLNSNGSFTYTPTGNYNGPDSFTYRTSDGFDQSNLATVSITVTPVNDAPVADVNSGTAAEDGSVDITLTGSDIDASTTLTYSIVDQPTNGDVVLNGAVATYTPDANFNGSDSFTFKVNDGTVDSAPALVSITVTPVNDAPVADVNSGTAAEDGSVDITLTGSDIDASTTLTYSIVDQPTNGDVVLNGAVATYTPDANFNGSDSFTFKVNDGTVDSAPALVSITVTPVNDAPVADVNSGTAAEDGSVDITLTGSDIDASTTLTYSIVDQPTNGDVVLNGAVATYTPDANFNGSDSFTFKVNDGTVDSAPALVSITVTPVNDAPVADVNSGTAAEDGSVDITLTGSDIDASTTLTYSIVDQPTNGDVVLNGAVATYTPDANFNGSDSFTFKVNDGTVDSAPALVSITVTPVNDAPVADVNSGTAAEDGSVDITLTGSDIDASTTLTYSIVDQPTNGDVVLNGAVATYTPDANFNGSDSFTFKVNDGTVDSAPALVSITVTPVNDAPVADVNSGTAAEDGSVDITLTGSDIDVPTTLTYSIVDQPTNGDVVLNGAVATYTPDANFNGSDSFTFKVNDGTVDSAPALVSITVTPVNDAPVADVNSGTAAEDGSVDITLTGSDIDASTTLTYSIVDQPTNGDVVLNGAVATYTPDANFNGSDSFTFKVNDGTVDSAPALVSITVTPVNDAPVADVNSGTAAEDGSVNITLTGSDIDVPTTLTYSIVDQPTNGDVVLNGAVATYTPDANFNGSDSFTFKVNDGTANSAPALVSLTVTPVNDAPVANVNSGTAAEDGSVNITLTGSDIDVPTTLTYSIVDQPTNGDVVLNGAVATYTPDANYNGSDSFTFKVNDGTVDSAPALVSITVTPVNDAPVADVNSGTAAEDGSVNITLTGSDIDVPTTLTYSIVDQPTNGSVVLNGAVATYTPTANFNGSDSFTFKVNDGTVDSAPALVSITVTPVNDAPVANVNSGTAAEDGSVNITLTGSDIDVPTTLTYSIVDQPTNGSVVLNGAVATYTPDANFNGSDSFTFKVNDGTANSAPALVSLTVTPVNDAPVATAQAVSLNQNGSVAITLTAVDPDGSPLTFVNGPAAHGVLTGTAPNLTYTPSPYYYGPDSFTFTVNDGSGASAPATVSITVNNIPGDGFVEWLAGYGLVADPQTDSDKDSINNGVEYVIGGNPANHSNASFLPTVAMVSADPDGINGNSEYFLFTYHRTFRSKYDPLTTIKVEWCPNLTGPWTNAVGSPGVVVLESVDPQRSGGDRVQVYLPRALATGGKLFARLGVFIDVPTVNQAPVAQPQSLNVNEDAALPVVLAASDANGDTLNYTVVTPPQHGSLGGTAPNVTYTPFPNYSGTDSFTFKANDGTVDSAPATVSITVNPLEEYNQWMATFLLSASPNTDSDGDSISNAVEYVIGGNPANQPDMAKLPTITMVNADPDNNSSFIDYMRFTYRRTKLANEDPSTTIQVKWSTSLNGTWTNAVGTAGVVVVPQINGAGAGVDLVNVYIPRSLASNGKLFARLGAFVNIP